MAHLFSSKAKAKLEFDTEFSRYFGTDRTSRPATKFEKMKEKLLATEAKFTSLRDHPSFPSAEGHHRVWTETRPGFSSAQERTLKDLTKWCMDYGNGLQGAASVDTTLEEGLKRYRPWWDRFNQIDRQVKAQPSSRNSRPPPAYVPPPAYRDTSATR